MMTLDEAIAHAEWKAKNCFDWADKETYPPDIRKCGEEHQQLADWLKELKQRREEDEE
jgi:hypothetical protein